MNYSDIGYEFLKNVENVFKERGFRELEPGVVLLTMGSILLEVFEKFNIPDDLVKEYLDTLYKEYSDKETQIEH
jgi:hypothetical protein